MVQDAMTLGVKDPRGHWAKDAVSVKQASLMG